MFLSMGVREAVSYFLSTYTNNSSVKFEDIYPDEFQTEYADGRPLEPSEFEEAKKEYFEMQERARLNFTNIPALIRNWYYDAVSITYEYGIISGYGNGKFGPGDTITREQVMTMVAKAMEITKLKADSKAGEAEQVLAAYGDLAKAASWAMDSIASCIKTGVVSGRSGKLVAPKDNITRAEVVVIVQRLLQKSNLI